MRTVRCSIDTCGNTEEYGPRLNLIGWVLRDSSWFCSQAHAIQAGDAPVRLSRSVTLPHENDAWNQGYDTGRESGLADGEQMARDAFGERIEAVERLAEHFRNGAPWSVRRSTNGAPYRLVAKGHVYGIAEFAYESDAQSIADILNAALQEAKS